MQLEINEKLEDGLYLIMVKDGVYANTVLDINSLEEEPECLLETVIPILEQVLLIERNRKKTTFTLTEEKLNFLGFVAELKLKNFN